MKALILAAGFGTRLRPLTNHTPKALVPVNNIPIIIYILSFLKHHKIKDIVINLHHLGHKIPQFLGNGSGFGMKIRYSHEPQILGTGGGIKKASRFFKDDFLIVNGDVIVDFDLSAMIRQHKNNKPTSQTSIPAPKQSPFIPASFFHKNHAQAHNSNGATNKRGFKYHESNSSKHVHSRICACPACLHHAAKPSFKAGKLCAHHAAPSLAQAGISSK